RIRIPASLRFATTKAAARAYDPMWRTRWSHGLPPGTTETIAIWIARAVKIAGAYRSRTRPRAERLPPAGRTVTALRMTTASRNTTWYRLVRSLPVAENRARALKRGHPNADVLVSHRAPAPKEGTTSHQISR